MDQVLRPASAPAPSGIKARLVALAFLAAGAGFGWFFALRPLQDARAGATHVEFSVKVFILAPMLLVGGVFLLIGGGPVLAAFRGPPKGRQQHIIVWTMFALALAAGGLGWWWMQTQLDQLGYRMG